MGNFLTQLLLSPVMTLQPLPYLLNATLNSTTYENNYTNSSVKYAETSTANLIEPESPDKNYFALLLLAIPMLTILGNGLVVMSICREKALQTTTNYLILSLAVADFLVALCVMPFAVYVEVEQSHQWLLPKFFCNLFIAGDVWASTASILNLVAVSWDRYMAVNSPIQYAQNSRKRIRVKATIFFVWFVSLVTAMPVVMGLNDLNDTEHCEFTNALYICVSSLISFYMPCIIIIVLYTIVLKKLKRRRILATLQTTKRRTTTTHDSGHQLVDDVSMCDASKIELNGHSLKRNDSAPTLSNDEIANGQMLKEFTLLANEHTIQGRGDCATSTTTHNNVKIVPQLLHEHSVVILPALMPNHNEQPRCTDIIKASLSDHNLISRQIFSNDRQNAIPNDNNNINYALLHVCASNKVRNGLQHRICRRRESKRSRKERKATQTLAVVLGVFLICWVPFFTCHLTNSVCKFRFNEDCIPLVAMFITTWLGYVNSFLNPIIYTVFNPMYRKAFKRVFRFKSKRYTKSR